MKKPQKNQIQFLQLADEIPYTRISYFRIKQVTSTSQNFEIKLDRKCQNLPQEKEYKIVRRVGDFRWLIERIGKESPWVVVVPFFAENGWSMADVIGGDAERIKLRKWYGEIYQTRVIERFLKMLSQVVLPCIYKAPGFVQTSLFTFLDKSYQLYKLDRYQESSAPKTSEEGVSPLLSWANSIGKGSMKLLGMLGVSRQEENRRWLGAEVGVLEGLRTELEGFNGQLEGMLKGLQVLETNFLSQQKQLKTKQKQLYEIFTKTTNLHKHITSILQQIDDSSKRCEILQKRNDDKLTTKEQMTIYEKFITREVRELEGELERMLTEFYEKCFWGEMEIKLTNVYPCKL